MLEMTCHSSIYFPLPGNGLLSEIFDCPADYFKCPQSFCIASRYICDGIAQCPGYEDELNCGNEKDLFQKI